MQQVSTLKKVVTQIEPDLYQVNLDANWPRNSEGSSHSYVKIKSSGWAGSGVNPSLPHSVIIVKDYLGIWLYSMRSTNDFQV